MLMGEAEMGVKGDSPKLGGMAALASPWTLELLLMKVELCLKSIYVQTSL